MPFIILQALRTYIAYIISKVKKYKQLSVLRWVFFFNV